MPGELVHLAGGTFAMGASGPLVNPGDGEDPVRSVTVAPFSIATTCVTNAAFTEFVERTGYVTDAQVHGWSYVFAGFLPAALRRCSPRADGAPWWCGVGGADWRHPEGPGSDIERRMDHPVVHVSWNDAVAFCRHAGTRLPTEPEWEYAARGGLEQCVFPWGDELDAGGVYHCNVWRGRFPTHNTAADGYRGTAPADAFAPNGYGLYNIVGNAWEWCADPWRPDEHDAEAARAMRGGSYLCHDSYCNRYRVSARTGNAPDTSAGHLGFRVAADQG